MSSASAAPASGPGLGQRRVLTTWWPLAASWMMMGAEQPLVGAVVARLAEPEVQLAAYGSVVYPLALVVEAPVIMLLAASTELSRDRVAFRALRRVAHGLGLGLSLLHLLLAATPLFDVVVRRVLDVPAAVLEPARLGLLLLLPWTWSIASRRFHQGLLIRHGRARAVGVELLPEMLAAARGEKAKPAAAKGRYVKSVSVSSTIGPGSKVDEAALVVEA